MGSEEEKEKGERWQEREKDEEEKIEGKGEIASQEGMEVEKGIIEGKYRVVEVGVDGEGAIEDLMDEIREEEEEEKDEIGKEGKRRGEWWYWRRRMRRNRRMIGLEEEMERGVRRVMRKKK